MFHVGQKVVCVEGEPTWGLFEGSVYTISRVGLFGGKVTRHHVDVSEIRNEIPLGWRATRFRPLVETKTDISIFTNMLTKEPVHA
jgi:hypothetical protein